MEVKSSPAEKKGTLATCWPGLETRPPVGVTAPQSSRQGLGSQHWAVSSGRPSPKVGFLSPGALECCLLVLPFFYYVKVLRGISKQPTG